MEIENAKQISAIRRERDNINKVAVVEYMNINLHTSLSIKIFQIAVYSSYNQISKYNIDEDIKLMFDQLWFVIKIIKLLQPFNLFFPLFAWFCCTNYGHNCPS